MPVLVRRWVELIVQLQPARDWHGISGQLRSTFGHIAAAACCDGEFFGADLLAVLIDAESRCLRDDGGRQQQEGAQNRKIHNCSIRSRISSTMASGFRWSVETWTRARLYSGIRSSYRCLACSGLANNGRVPSIV